jgi:tetratricopeptide (TPR) repeat protein
MRRACDLPDLYETWDYSKPAETERKFREILSVAREAEDRDYLVQLLTQIARTRVFQGDYEGAHKLLDEADDILTEECTVGQVRSILERGRVYSSSGEVEIGGSLFLKAFVQSFKSARLFYAVDAIHMLAIISKPEDAIQWNDLALSIIEDSTDERVQDWRGSLYNNIGWSHYETGNFESAVSYFEKSLAYRNEKKQPRRARSAKWAIGRALRAQERLEEALTVQQELMKEYEEEGIDEDGLTSEEIGECLWALGKTEEARPYLTRAYEKLSKVTGLAEAQSDRIESLKVRTSSLKDGESRDQGRKRDQV